MRAKLIVLGRHRSEALARIEQALKEFHVLGVRTNISFLLDVIRHAAFRDGRTHTGFLAEHFAGWQPKSDVPEEVLLALAAESVTRPNRSDIQGADSLGDLCSPWRTGGAWRNSTGAAVVGSTG